MTFPQRSQSYFRYMKVDARARQWGAYVTTCGKSLIKPNSSYPPVEHPTLYHFNWELGRKLRDYQLIYIREGSGRFETHNQKIKIQPDSVILLTPGLWHRYRPNSETGWQEFWVGFAGTYYDALFKSGFFRDRHIIRVSQPKRMTTAFEALLAADRDGCPALQQVLASHTNLLLAMTYGATLPARTNAARAGSLIVQKAREFMLADETSQIPLEKVARILGVNYSHFRRTFREHTGLSPHQYRIQLKLNYARDLLLNTQLSIKEIAFRSGYEEEPYFCRLFKKHYGKTPSSYRGK